MREPWYYWVFACLFLIAAFASIIMRERNFGQLRKKWYKWLIVALLISGVLWWPLARDMISLGLVVSVIVMIIVIIATPLWRYLYKWLFPVWFENHEKRSRPSEGGPVYRFPSTQWWLEMCTTGILGACACTVLGIFINISVDVGDIGRWILVTPRGILILSIVWTLPTLLVVLLARFRLGRRQVSPYGVVSGIFGAIAFAVTMSVPSRYLSYLMFVCPIVGGFLGERLFFLLDKKRRQSLAG